MLFSEFLITVLFVTVTSRSMYVQVSFVASHQSFCQTIFIALILYECVCRLESNLSRGDLF